MDSLDPLQRGFSFLSAHSKCKVLWTLGSLGVLVTDSLHIYFFKWKQGHFRYKGQCLDTCLIWLNDFNLNDWYSNIIINIIDCFL